MRFLSRHLGRFHWRIATNGTNDSSSTRRPRWCHGTATSVSQMGGDVQAISVRPEDPSSSSSGCFNFFEESLLFLFVSIDFPILLLLLRQVNISFPGIGQRVAHGYSVPRRGAVSRGFFQRIPRGHVEESSTASSAVPPIASTFHLQVGLSPQVSRLKGKGSSPNFLPTRT